MEKTMLSGTVPYMDTRDKCVLSADKSADFVNDFIGFYQMDNLAEADKCVTSLLAELYGTATARAFNFLLNQVDNDVRLRFAYTYLAPEALASHVTTCIVVKPTTREQRTSLTIGRYAVFMRPADGTPDVLVKFPTQVATVFYLQHLIERRNSVAPLPPHQLHGAFFRDVYQAVYPISNGEALRRFTQLHFRVVDGKVRAGRKGQTIREVQRSLEKVFAQTADSFVPYAMTARSHLAVPSHRIVFEGEAQTLLLKQPSSDSLRF